MLYKLTKERGQLPGEQTWLDRQGSSSSAETGGSSSKKSKTGNVDGDQDSEDEEKDDVLNGNVLMVDQLWLWAIDSRELQSRSYRKRKLTGQIPCSHSSRSEKVMQLRDLCTSKLISVTASSMR